MDSGGGGRRPPPYRPGEGSTAQGQQEAPVDLLELLMPGSSTSQQAQQLVPAFLAGPPPYLPPSQPAPRAIFGPVQPAPYLPPVASARNSSPSLGPSSSAEAGQAILSLLHVGRAPPMTQGGSLHRIAHFIVLITCPCREGRPPEWPNPSLLVHTQQRRSSRRLRLLRSTAWSSSCSRALGRWPSQSQRNSRWARPSRCLAAQASERAVPPSISAPTTSLSSVTHSSSRSTGLTLR